METVLESILQAVREGSPVQIRRFGTFAIRQRGGRVGRNPKTGSQVQVSPQARSLFQAKHRAAGVDQPASCEPWRQGVAAKSVVFIVPFIPAVTSMLLRASVYFFSGSYPIVHRGTGECNLGAEHLVVFKIVGVVAQVKCPL